GAVVVEFHEAVVNLGAHHDVLLLALRVEEAHRATVARFKFSTLLFGKLDHGILHLPFTAPACDRQALPLSPILRQSSGGAWASRALAGRRGRWTAAAPRSRPGR